LALYGALWLGIGTAYADGELTSSANPSAVDQDVTFTWAFTLTCSDGAQVIFTVDGQSHSASVNITDGIHVAATYTTSFSTAGGHSVVATYDGSPMPNCSGSSPTLVQVVNAPAPPPPGPGPSPPAAEPTPSESPSPLAVESPIPASGARSIGPANSAAKFPAVPVALLVLAAVIGGGIYVAVRLGQR
jgi:hypothetical protein